MKHTTLTISLFIAVFLIRSEAQVGVWVQQQVPPGMGELHDIDMWDTQFGFACGQPNLPFMNSGVMLTINGGTNWYWLPDAHFQPALPSWTVWRAIAYVDRNTLVVAGDSALIYVTTNGGLLWERDTTTKFKNPVTTIRDIYFNEFGVGVLVGGDSFVTNPGGQVMTPPLIARADFGSGSTDWQEESPGTGALFNDPSLRAVRYKNGAWITSGELSSILRYNGTNWTILSPPTADKMDTFSGLTVLGPNEFWVSGANPFQRKPKVYRTVDGGARYFNMLPSPLVQSIESFSVNYFFSPSYGWIGFNPYYLNVTTNSGFNWLNFQTAGVPPSTDARSMDFIDSLNGWAIGSDWIIRYYGSPPKSDISNSETSGTFPDATCETFVETEVTIRNRGTGDLVINDGEISFSSSEYTLVGITYPIRIPAGKGKKLTIRWTPLRTTSGDVSATMTIYSNDPDHNPWFIQLNGKRFYGALIVETPIDIQPGVCLRDSTDWYASGYFVGNRPPTLIAFDFVSGHNDFRLISPAIGTVINGGLSFRYRFRTSVAGQRNGRYRVISGNPSCPDTSYVDFQGFGDFTKVTPNVTEVDFGKVCIRTLRDTTITLTATGNTYSYVGSRSLVSGQDVFPSREPIPIFIKQDSSKTYRLRFAPTLTGKFEATYRIVSDPCPDTLTIKLKGEGISTELTFIPQGQITVGPTFVGRTVTRTVTIRNTSATPAMLESLKFATMYPELTLIGVPPLPRMMQPGDNFDIMIRYSPLKLGTITTSLNAYWSSVCSDTGKLLVEAPCVPNPVIDPPLTMTMKTQPCPTPIRDTLWIRNKGNGPLVFYGASFTGPDKDYFRLIKPVIDDSVRAGDSTRLIIEFNRPTEGTSTAGLYLNHNDFDRTPTLININARRTVVDFTVLGDSTTEFFTRLFVPETRTFTIRNTSNNPLTITGIDVTRATAVFAVQSGASLPATLAPGQSITFDVIFTPNARGPFRGTITVSGKECGLTALLNVTGRGDTDGLSLDKGNIDFDLSPCAFESMCDTLTLSNQGNEPVTVLGLNINQAGNVFAITPTVIIPFTLNPNQERKVFICADASALGTHNGVLTVTSNDPVYPSLQVALTAKRDSSAVVPSVSEVDFGKLAVCATTLTRQITIQNFGNVREIVSTALAINDGAFSSDGGRDITLLPGRSFSFTVTFNRTGFGVFDDTVLVTYERCPTVIRIPLRGEWARQEYVVTPSPLSFPPVNLGSTSTRSLTLQNNGGFNAHISGITIQPSGNFSVQPGYPTDIAQGTSGDIQIRFSPQSEGSLSATACIIFDSPCPDTLCVPLEGDGIRGTLAFLTPLLTFNLLAQCETQELLDTLRNNGSAPVTLLNASFTGPGRAAFTNLTPIGSPEVLNPGAIREFRIRYNAAAAPSDGVITAALTVNTDNVFQPMIDLTLEAQRHTLRASQDVTLNLGVVEVGQPVQRTIVLRNTGSARLCYSTATVSGGLAFTPALPVCIDPGDTLELSVTFTPITAGSYNGSISLRVNAPCSDSTVVRVNANVQQGTLSQTTSLDFGTGAWCRTTQLTVTITNTYLQDVTLDSLRVNGAGAPRFTIVSPTTFPQTITSGGSLDITISFNGVNENGAYAAQLVSFLTSLGLPVTLQTTLTAESQTPSLTVAPASFATVVVGQAPSQTSTTITNTSTLPLEVASVVSGSPAFTVLSTNPPVPATLGPGQSITVQLQFAPQSAGTFDDSLRVASNQPCPLSVRGALHGVGIPQPIVQVALSIGTIEGKPDDRVLIPINVDKDLGASDVRSWSGEITFNRSMLYPLRVVKENSLSSAMNVVMNFDQQNSTVTLNGSGAPVSSGTGALIYVECLVLIGNNVETALALSTDFDFTSGYATVTSRQNGLFKLTGYCMVGSRLVQGIGFTKLEQSFPNPVSLTHDARATIAYAIAEDGYVEIALYDAVGRVRQMIVESQKTAGLHTVTTDFSHLPPGIYHYRMTYGSFADTKRVIVVK